MRIDEIVGTTEDPVEKLDVIYVEMQGKTQKLDEGKWIDGSFQGKIRVDEPTYGAGQKHAHVYGRRGDELGTVNVDGTGSHGTKMKLPDPVAKALRDIGFDIMPNGIVEWVELGTQTDFLCE